MAYATLPLQDFRGGLNLAAGTDDPDLFDQGEAIDCLNVTFTQLGALKQRLGYAKLSGALTNQPDSIHAVYTSSGTKRLLVGNGNRIDALNTSGTSVANTTAPTTSPHFFQRQGSPTQEAVYFANGTDTVRKYVPSTDTFSTPTYAGTTPTGMFVSSFDTRLVNARLASNPSRVQFSGKGLPESFSSNVAVTDPGSANYVDLDPGDGEPIMGMVNWRDMLFVFKQTKFYVFTGVGALADGSPDFSSYRAVRSGRGLVASKAVTAARDGVYFLDRTGVYRTVGQEPQPVSQKLDPFFTGIPSIYFKSTPLNAAQITSAAMGYYNERLYLSVPTAASTNDVTFVYDPRYGWWTLWDIPMAAMTCWRPANAEELVFAYPATSKVIGRYSDNSSYTADNMATDATGGTACTARWRSGWFSLYKRYHGRWWPVTQVEKIRQVKIWGEGSVTCQLSRDYRDTFTPALGVTFGPTTDTWGDGTDVTKTWGDGTDPTKLWGPAGTTKERLLRGLAIRGTEFSVLFQNTTINRSFTIHKAEMHMLGEEPESVVERD